jgi:hypothetical protein
MRQEFGTTKLATDYGVFDAVERVLDPAEIRNSDDYDDWEYGTEPIPHDSTWTKKHSS